MRHTAHKYSDNPIMPVHPCSYSAHILGILRGRLKLTSWTITSQSVPCYLVSNARGLTPFP